MSTATARDRPGLSAKKRPATYGGRRRPAHVAKPNATTTSPPSSPDLESLPSRPATTAAAQRVVPVPTPVNADRKPAAARRPTVRSYVRPSLASSSSQPLPETTQLDGEAKGETRVARRQTLIRSYTEKRSITPPPYSTPDSSPFEMRSPASASEQKVKKPATGLTAKTPVKKLAPDISPWDVPMYDDTDELQLPPPPLMTARRVRNSATTASRQAAPTAAPMTQVEMPIRLTDNKPSRQPPNLKKRSSPGPTSRPPRKKRLIDALAAQVESSSASDEEVRGEEVEEEAHSSSQCSSSTAALPIAASSPPKPIRAPARPLTVDRSGPRSTYGQRRTMLADDPDPLLAGLGADTTADDVLKPPSFGFGAMPKTSKIDMFAFLDQDDETDNAGAVKSVHELRQAGANSRFMDELDDIMSYIGSPSAKPSSTRRGAVLELAQKLQDKDFRTQFRSVLDLCAVFKHLDQEKDVVAGFGIAIIIVLVLQSFPLGAAASAHFVQQLHAQGVGSLMNRLLKEDVDIVRLAKDRRTNVSKTCQRTLGEIKTAHQDVKVHGSEALSTGCTLSPRSLSLKCLDLVLQESADPSHILTPNVADQLFSILAGAASDDKFWGFPSQLESIDIYLTLFMLKNHAVSAMHSRLGSVWTQQHLPVVANVLKTALGHDSVDQLSHLQELVFQVTIDMTNNNRDACAVFIGKDDLLPSLSGLASSTFESVRGSTKDEAFLSKAVDHVILMLGIMINFVVHYEPTLQRFHEMDAGSGSTVDRLVQVFTNYHSKTADASNMVESQLNVAFGYLSTLLGYLCLDRSIRETFVSTHPKKSLEPLLESLREFIQVHLRRNKDAEAAGMGSAHESESVVRLQSLVNQLESQEHR